MPIALNPNALGETGTPKTRRAPRRVRGDAPDAALSELHERVMALRSEAFDLVRELSERDGRRGGEYERASVRMQSVANQLAAVQTLVAPRERS